MPEHLLAIDAGTTSIRVLIVGLDGTVCARVRETLPIAYPAPGRVEQDPEQIWRATTTLLHAALREAKLTASDIAAIGVTTQRASCMIWERATGRALTPLVSWQDLRGAARSAELRDAGFFVLPQSAAAKLESVLDAIPNGRARAATGELAWGNIDSYLVHRLSGGAHHATDLSQACATAYIRPDGHWDTALIEHQDLPLSFFPEIVDTSGRLGELAAAILEKNIPIGAIVGDQQSAAIAQGVHAPGDGKVTYGTSGTANVHTGDSIQIIRGTYPLFLSRRGGVTEFCVEGMVITAGAALDWLSAGLGIVSSLSDLDALAASVPDSGGVSVLPAFQGLGSPHGDTIRRALITGLSRATKPAHIVRATIDGIAYRVREVLDTIYKDAPFPRPGLLRADGGATASGALMQAQADTLDIPVERMQPHDASAYGAALLAGEGVGILKRSDIARLRTVDRTFEPLRAADERESRYAAWRAACDLA